ncbi:hsp90 co-chaperone Cdc37-like 1 isoform X2 [Serinus canaria]|uniref:hsp90 co-chaperone Cdc37-like 1 isoform X2 n=1 Tax=Serinus canaria TaxID=9135 RepID=UPI0021CD10C1|nr:hsp90 co-chaperone Cdc37-like 1 isoform X2 [Serinus canaria]
MALWFSSLQGLGSVEEDEEREFTLTSIQRLSEWQNYDQGIELICQKQEEFVKSSIESKWNLAEAQQKLGSLALHNSESMDQEYAKAQTEASELRQREEEWKRKEAALIERERQNLWNTDSFSKEVFNKSFISKYKRKEDEDEDISKSFIQKHEQKIRYFGMLGRWDDSQRFLSDHPYLVCEETAKYLILWCFHLEAEQKRALMEQIAHQALVMQFIIEMARSCNVDPRGYFRLFFQKAKGQRGRRTSEARPVIFLEELRSSWLASCRDRQGPAGVRRIQYVLRGLRGKREIGRLNKSLRDVCVVSLIPVPAGRWVDRATGLEMGIHSTIERPLATLGVSRVNPCVCLWCPDIALVNALCG